MVHAAILRHPFGPRASDHWWILSGPPRPNPRVIDAYSPTTRRWYPMTCVANATMGTCSGGDDAVVYVY